MNWTDFEDLPLSQDAAIEEAVKKIGQIAIAGHGKGYVFNAGAVRKVLRDAQRETAEEACRVIGTHSCTCAKVIRERFGPKEKA